MASEPIDLVVVNLYPFEAMSDAGLSLDEIIEYIDIGGPAMVRAAAKNHKYVAVVVDPADYHMVADAGPERRVLARRAVESRREGVCPDGGPMTARSRTTSPASTGRSPRSSTSSSGTGGRCAMVRTRTRRRRSTGDAGIAAQETLQGKQMSYNNYLDVDAAVGLLREFEECAVVIVKHNNPCGVATGDGLLETYIAARGGRPGLGLRLDRRHEPRGDRRCRPGSSPGTFVEVVIAPSYTPEALEIMKVKKNMRVLRLPEPVVQDEIRSIDGGVLVQRRSPTARTGRS